MVSTSPFGFFRFLLLLELDEEVVTVTSSSDMALRVPLRTSRASAWNFSSAANS